MESFRTQRVALIIVLIIVATTFNEIKPLSYAQDNNCSSSCGNIHHITFPFRLRTDPPNCGYGWYELSCKDNHTLSLHISDEEYLVKAINYKSYTIRIVAAVVRKDNCSSIPHLPLSSSDFVNEKPFYSLYETEIRPRQHGGVTRQISETVTFLSCENPARDNPSYIDTSTCINGSDFSRMNRGKNYSYVVYGNGFRFSDLEESCQVYHTALVSPTKNVGSIEEIHDAISNGFEISTALAISDIDTDDCSCLSGTTLYCPRRIKLLEVIKSIPSMTYLILQFALNIMYEYTFEVLLPKVGIHISPGTHAMAFQLVLVFGPRTTVGISFVIALIIYKWKRRHLSLYAGIEEFLQRHNNLMPIRYAYSDIKKMTDNFKTKLGEGGFGCVYKGKLRSGHFVAIKMLGKSKSSGQDFVNEVATIGRIHHVNIVRLIGFCVEGSKRALVYEFMPNGSLDKHIFSRDQGINCSSLSSIEIHGISLGVARGIEYLHRGCDMQILHFDIKPHNILLDENFTPKVSDFGLARLCPLDDNTISLTAARGTIGYIAPELFYKNIGGVSYKADVYSFGMLLMEMASNRKNVDAGAENSSQIYFPSWIYGQISQGNEMKIIEDATEVELKITKKMMIVALWCIQLKPCDRPSMSEVIEMLEGDVESIEMPPKPLLFPQESHIAEHSSETSSATSSSTLVGKDS